MNLDTSSPAYLWARRKEKEQAKALAELLKLLRGNPKIRAAYIKAVEVGAIR